MKDDTSRLFSTLSYSFITVHRLIIHRVLWVCQVFFSGENFFDHLGGVFSGEFFLEGFFWGIFSGEFFLGNFSGEFFGDVSLCGSWRTYWRAGNFFFGCVFVRWYGQAPVWTQNVPTGFYWCLSSEKNPAVPLDTAGSGVRQLPFIRTAHPYTGNTTWKRQTESYQILRRMSGLRIRPARDRRYSTRRSNPIRRRRSVPRHTS